MSKKPKVKSRIIGALICAVTRSHYVSFTAETPYAWKAEMERQIEKVGYVDCFCDRCGKHVLRIHSREGNEISR